MFARINIETECQCERIFRKLTYKISKRKHSIEYASSVVFFFFVIDVWCDKVPLLSMLYNPDILFHDVMSHVFLFSHKCIQDYEFTFDDFVCARASECGCAPVFLPAAYPVVRNGISIGNITIYWCQANLTNSTIKRYMYTYIYPNDGYKLNEVKCKIINLVHTLQTKIFNYVKRIYNRIFKWQWMMKGKQPNWSWMNERTNGRTERNERKKQKIKCQQWNGKR